MPSSTQQNITLSYKSIIRVVIVLVSLFLVYLVRDVLALLFVAVIFSAAVDPWVDWLQKHKVHRAVSILMIYAISLAVFSLVVVMMIPPVTQQIGQIVNNFPTYYEKISTGLNSLHHQAVNNNLQADNASIVATLKSLSLTLAQTTRSVFVTITGIFGGLFSLLVVLVIIFYITVEENSLKKFIKQITPLRHQAYTMRLIERMQVKIGLWLRGQLLLSLIIGVATYIGLTILGVKYALLLAIIAGSLEIVPYLGPWLSAIPAVIVAFSDSLTKVIFVAALYLFIQQSENNLIVPKLMNKVVGLNPIVVIMAILIGAKLGGIIGALLGVPVAAAISVYLDDVIENKEKKEAAVGGPS